MDALNIIIDSSILKKDKRLSSKNFNLLKKLSQLGFVKLHFPWIVYKEFTTGNIADISIDINKALKSIRSLNLKGLGESEHQELLKISKSISFIKHQITQSVEKVWQDYVFESKATVHTIKDTHGKSVMDSYFNGSKPFSSFKNRNDIPDAFIYESVTSIANSNDNAIFICNDKNLRESYTDFTNIKTYDSLEQFMESNEYQNINTEYKKIEHYVDELIELEKHIDIIQDNVSDNVSDFLNSMINTDVKSENIPSDDNEGTFVFLEDIYSTKIDKDNIIFINDVFYMKVKVLGSARIEYFLYKWDDYLIENRNNADIVDKNWSDHYYIVNESYDFELSFDCLVHKNNIKGIEKAYERGDFDFYDIDEGTVSFDKLNIT
jgi:hypothetical protein